MRENKSMAKIIMTGGIDYECPECGSDIELGQNYCKDCGEGIDWIEEDK
jgi:predicted amidophosphoribosyltransferase